MTELPTDIVKTEIETSADAEIAKAEIETFTEAEIVKTEADTHPEAEVIKTEIEADAEAQMNGVNGSEENVEANGSGQTPTFSSIIPGTIYSFDDLSEKNYSDDETYKKVIQFGVDPVIASELMEAINDGVLKENDIEDRTLDFLKNIVPDQGRFVLCQFRKAKVLGIVNPSAYLGSLIKNFKERVKVMGTDLALSTPFIHAPVNESIQKVVDNKGYSLEVTIGQRKYGGPPPNFDGTAPGAGCEMYVGKIPKEVFEDELIPAFEQYGDLYDFRLMMDPTTGLNKGYGFATFMKKADAAVAAEKLDNYEIKPGKKIHCNVSIANTRLFIGNIPKTKGKEEILDEFTNNAEIEGIVDVIVYPATEDPERRKNRGFCFLEFREHKYASGAKRRLSQGRIRPFNRDIFIDWAEPLDVVDEDTMAQVKSLYIKTLPESHTEEMVKEAFSSFGEIDKVKKVKDYCFVHYMNREDALKALEAMNHADLNGVKIEVSLARPQTDRKKQQRPFPFRGGGHFGAMGGGYGGPMYGGMGAGGGGNMYNNQAGYGAGYDYGGYGAGGGFGGGYAGAPPANNGPYGAYGSPAPFGTPPYAAAGTGGFSPAATFGSPMDRGRGGFVPRGRGGPRGGFGSPMAMGAPRGAGAGMRGGFGARGGPGFGGSPGFRGGGISKAGNPIKRPFSGGVGTSPKRQNNNF